MLSRSSLSPHLIRLCIFVACIPFCYAQSGGAAADTGVVTVLLLIFCFPCCVCCCCCYYIKLGAATKQEKKVFFSSIYPASSPTSILPPRDGTYKGHFMQGFDQFSMEVSLKFEEQKSKSDGNIRVYLVKGEGSDDMGTFEVRMGECQIGRTGRLFFRKYYMRMIPPHKPEVMHHLVYEGELATSKVGKILGDWKFVEAEPSDRLPHVTGQFELELSTGLTPGQEASIEISNETPVGSTPGGIILEKTPLLPSQY